MKFMVRWRTHSEKRHETLKAFSEMTAEDHAAQMGDGVKLIGRWHDLVGCTGVAILEAADANALSQYVLKWNAVLDAEISVVVDDAEASEIGKSISG